MKDDKLIEKAIKVAVQVAIEHLEKEKENEKHLKHERRLRNTKLLLRNYRNFKEHVKDVKTELENLNQVIMNDIFENNELAIESIRRSKERTLAIVSFIEQMLLSYRIQCEKSGDPVEERRYKIIHDLYISDKRKSIDEIVTCHFIDRRTVFRDVNKAVETLSVLFFGVDGLRMK